MTNDKENIMGKKNSVGMKAVTESTKISIRVSYIAHLTIAQITEAIPPMVPIVDRLLEKISEGNAVAFIERSSPLAVSIPTVGFEDFTDPTDELFGNVRVIQRGPLLLTTVIVADETEDIAHVLVIDAGMVQ